MREATYLKTTIVFPQREGETLLGMKKRGFGEGWWNGFGGKLEAGETYEDSARRETLEEVGIKIGRLLHIADLHFYFGSNLGVVSRAYAADFAGEPLETEEMQPQFFPTDQLPYDTMWPADKLWVPEALSARHLPLGYIIHFDTNKTFESIARVNPEQLDSKF